MVKNLNNAEVTDYSNITAFSIDSVRQDTVQNQDETRWTNSRWSLDWSYFNSVAKLRSAIIMGAIWRCGKGWKADMRTTVKLEHIRGDGKQSFDDILFAMDVNRMINGDSFAEIIRHEESGEIINLKILDPGSITIIYDKRGMIKRYEQRVPVPTKGDSSSSSSQGFISFEPEDIFHLSFNKFGAEMHGRSVPEALEATILADRENFAVMQKLTRFQAVPFIIFKLKTDDQTKIAQFKSKLKAAKQDGEDFCVPDDENLVSWEVVQVSPSAILMEWRNSINNQFYQECGMPLILFGAAGSTESGGKIEYLAHEQVFEFGQNYLEKQIKNQLGWIVNLNSPVTLLENLQNDESKDQQNALGFSQGDVAA